MARKEEWLTWIDDQLRDMYDNDHYIKRDNNRVFKTEEDDRDIAVYVLEKLREMVLKNDGDV